MKKLKILSLILIGLLLFTGCKGKEEQSSKYLVNLSYSEFKEMQKEKKTFFMAVIQDGCPHCENYIPILTEVLEEYEITGYTLNLTNLTRDEHEEFYNDYKVNGTPNTIFFKDGEEISIMQRIDGEASKTRIISKLKNNGYIE